MQNDIAYGAYFINIEVGFLNIYLLYVLRLF